MLSINSTLKDWTFSALELKFYFTNGVNLLLTDYHDQDCCEDVAADWEEIPLVLLNELKGLYITSFELKPEPKGEGGFLMIFNHAPIEDPKLPEELWINRKIILVGCHNIQNGYYSNCLEIKAIKKIEDKEIKDTEKKQIKDIKDRVIENLNISSLNTLTLNTKQGLKFSKERIN